MWTLESQLIAYCFMNIINSDMLLVSHAVFYLLYSREVGISGYEASLTQRKGKKTICTMKKK